MTTVRTFPSGLPMLSLGSVFPRALGEIGPVYERPSLTTHYANSRNPGLPGTSGASSSAQDGCWARQVGLTAVQESCEQWAVFLRVAGKSQKCMEGKKELWEGQRIMTAESLGIEQTN